MKTERLRLVFGRVRLLFAFFAVLAILGCGPSSIEGLTDFGRGEAQGHPRFTERDRELIRDFFDRYRFDLSLAKPAILAPDLAERIEESAILPPGLGELPLPRKLEAKLSPMQPPFARFMVGSDVVLMNVQTREVQDVVKDVFR
jgi:hypothetical protein